LDAFLDDSHLNEAPVIGILTQTLEGGMSNDSRFGNYSSYVMTAYAQFIEAAGARVVPLVLG